MIMQSGLNSYPQIVMATPSYPTPWFAPLPLDGDGWWGPLRCADGSGDSTSGTTDGAMSLTLGPFGTYGCNEFINKTYKLVDDPASHPFITWVHDGRSVLLSSVPEVSEVILPRHFENIGFFNFIINLSAYGFKIRLKDQKLVEVAKDGFFRGHSSQTLDTTITVQSLLKMSELKIKEETSPGLKVSELRIKEETSAELKLRKLKTEENMPSKLKMVQLLKRKKEMDAIYTTSPSFISMTYHMVNDPATDHIVSLGPTGHSFVVSNMMEFSRDLLMRHYNLQDFYNFVLLSCMNGFRFRSTNGQQFEFAKEGFVKIQKHFMRRRGPLIRIPLRGPSLRQLKTSDNSKEIKKKTEGVNEGTKKVEVIPLMVMIQTVNICIYKMIQDFKEVLFELVEERKKRRFNVSKPRPMQGPSDISHELGELEARIRGMSIQDPTSGIVKLVEDILEKLKEVSMLVPKLKVRIEEEESQRSLQGPLQGPSSVELLEVLMERVEEVRKLNHQLK